MSAMLWVPSTGRHVTMKQAQDSPLSNGRRLSARRARGSLYSIIYIVSDSICETVPHSFLMRLTDLITPWCAYLKSVRFLKQLNPREFSGTALLQRLNPLCIIAAFILEGCKQASGLFVTASALLGVEKVVTAWSQLTVFGAPHQP
jgi:hypothetical protein